MKKYRQLAKEIVPTKSLLTVLTPTQSGNKHLIESIISDPLLARKTDHPAPHIPKTIIKKPIVETISETISEAVLIEVAPPSVPQPPVAFAPVSMPQETPVPVVPVSTDNMNKYLTDKSFQQPNPDPVPQEMDAVTAKLKFLEQAIGRIAAHGPGSGEVNLRYLDDVDRPSIIDGKFLKYNGTTKKFEFADPLLGDIDIAQVNSDWDAVSGVAEILNKPTIPASQLVYVVNSAVTMSTGTGVQNLFGLTNGVTLVSNTRYIYRMVFTLAKTGPHNPILHYSLGLGAGTALAKHAYSVQSNNNTTRTGFASGVAMMTNDITTGFSTGVEICSTGGSNRWQAFVFEGIIDVTTGGNVSFRLQGDQSVTALSMLSLGMITLMPVGAIGANTAAGTWS